MDAYIKPWTLIGKLIGGMALLACACNFFTATPVPPVPTQTQAPPAPANPLPELEGYWQLGPTVYTVEWQDGGYAVTGLDSADSATGPLIDSSWDGKALTWSHEYRPDYVITYTTQFIQGDKLVVGWSGTGTGSYTLRRVSSPQPSYDPLPYYDDFSDPTSGLHQETADLVDLGYYDGYYSISTRKTSAHVVTYLGKFLGDAVIEVDVTPVRGPGYESFVYAVGCRASAAGNAYKFQLTPGGYYLVTYEIGGNAGDSVSGDDWQFSDAIKQGMVTNHIAVTCAGDTLKLAVNGQVIYEVQHTALTQGDVFLTAYTADENEWAEVHYDNLVIISPDGGASQGNETEYSPLPYLDDFSDPTSGWDIYEDDASSTGYQEGYYYIGTTSKGVIQNGTYPGITFADTRVKVDVTPIIGPSNKNFGYAVGCRNQGNGDGYQFIVTADGYYSVGLFTGGGQEFTSLSGEDWQDSSAIRQGMATNTIAATCARGLLRLTVNDQVLFEGQDSTYTSGMISVAAVTYEDNAPVEVHFDNLEVTEP